MKEFGVAAKLAPMSLDGSLVGSGSASTAKMTLAELQKRKEEEAKRKTELPASPVLESTPAGEGDGKIAVPLTTPAKTPSLENVSVKLESVQPSTTLTPLSLYDRHGLKVLLFFAQVACYPSPEVAVAILTTMSTNTLPLKAYHFQV